MNLAFSDFDQLSHHYSSKYLCFGVHVQVIWQRSWKVGRLFGKEA